MVQGGIGWNQLVFIPDLDAVPCVVEENLGIAVDVENFTLHQGFEVALGRILDQRDIITLIGQQIGDVQRIVPGVRQFGCMSIVLFANDDGIALGRAGCVREFSGGGWDMSFRKESLGAVLRCSDRGDGA